MPNLQALPHEIYYSNTFNELCHLLSEEKNEIMRHFISFLALLYEAFIFVFIPFSVQKQFLLVFVMQNSVVIFIEKKASSS